eukprot:403349125
MGDQSSNSKSKLNSLTIPLLDSTNDRSDQCSGIGIEKQSNLKEITMSEALISIYKQSIYPIIGLIAHSLYSIQNAVMLGNMESMDSTGKVITSNNALAAYGIGTMTTSAILFATGYTFNSYLGTLVSQAYGQMEYRLCALYLNRQIYLNIVIYLPFIIPILLSERFYLFVGIDGEIAHLAGTYCILNLPAHLIMNISNCYTRYLAGQREVKIGMYSNIISAIIYAPVAYFFVIYLNQGLYGCAYSINVFFLSRLITQHIFIHNTKYRKQLISLFDQDNFILLLPQFKSSFNSAFMGIWSWWAFDIFTFIASFLTTDQMAAQTICRSIGLIFFMIPLGVSQASGVLVGNQIGAQNVQGARMLINMTVLTGFLWGMFNILIMFTLKEQIIHLFSSSESVNTYIVEIFKIFSIFVFVDCLQYSAIGIIAGLGKQAVCSWITLLGFWGVGIPTSLIYVFYFNGGLFGIQFGQILAVGTTMMFYFYIIHKSDLKLIGEQAFMRKFKEKKIPQ